MSAAEPLLVARGLRKSYPAPAAAGRRRSPTVALGGVDLELESGATVALVGESGSGKSTLARCLALHERPDGGEIRYRGLDPLAVEGRRRRALRREIQLIFQDSAMALNPRLSGWQSLEEPLLVAGRTPASERRRLAAEAAEQVGLARRLLDRSPLDLSGGQRQRLAIARALTLRPRILILDESLSGLDLSIQARIANLLVELQATRGLTYLYVSHDLSMVGQLADRVVVLEAGRVVERATAAELFAAPRHRHTRELLLAASFALPAGVDGR